MCIGMFSWFFRFLSKLEHWSSYKTWYQKMKVFIANGHTLLLSHSLFFIQNCRKNMPSFNSKCCHKKKRKNYDNISFGIFFVRQWLIKSVKHLYMFFLLSYKLIFYHECNQQKVSLLSSFVKMYREGYFVLKGWVTIISRNGHWHYKCRSSWFSFFLNISWM